jgi:hypothetical protein
MLSSFFMLDGSSPSIISRKQDRIDPHFRNMLEKESARKELGSFRPPSPSSHH